MYTASPPSPLGRLMQTALTSLATLLLIALTAFSCSSKPAEAQIQARIQSVEHGLVAVRSLADAFQTDSTRLQEKLALREQMEQLGVPGVSIAVINDSRIEWSKGYGVLRNDAPDTVTTETLFEAASVTKQLTAVMALQAVDQDLLRLDGAVNEQLQSWQIPDNEYTQQQPVTLYQLLTHQGGISRPDGGFGYPDETPPSLLQVLNGESPAENGPAVVEFVPSSQWQYSNLGFVVIQQLLEDSYQQPYAQLIRQQLFEPLGMRSSMVMPSRPAELGLPFASPHDGEGTAHDHSLHETALAHGALITTPSDLARFTIEIMHSWQGRSRRILSQGMAQDMLDPKCPVDVFGINGQGLGFFLISDEHTRYFVAMGSNWPGTFCAVVANPESGHGAVIMSNAQLGAYLAMELLAALALEYDWPTVTSAAAPG
ncbi:serine hydrolase domain-containing protein [Candidatus Neomarinimicrobiota bacterium]